MQMKKIFSNIVKDIEKTDKDEENEILVGN